MKKKTWQGKICLVTGGSSGIGLALAELLAGLGACTWLVARRLDQLVQAQNLILQKTGRPVFIAQVDVSSREQVESLKERIFDKSGYPDLLINSAGLTRPGYVQELDLDVFRILMDVNYHGTVNMTKAVLPGMLARGSGHIVNISSVSGFLGIFGYSAYGASKFAVRGFTDALRCEMKPHGIDVSLVFPPDTDTPQLMDEEPYKPAELKAINTTKVLSPVEVANEILKGIERHRYLILPGPESKLLYFLSGILGTHTYTILDWMISGARKKLSDS